MQVGIVDRRRATQELIGWSIFRRLLYYNFVDVSILVEMLSRFTIVVLVVTMSCSTRQQADLSGGFDDRIILINYQSVDRESISKAIDHVNEGKPKIIGINALFKELRFNKGDTLLSKAIEKNDNVIIASSLNVNDGIESSHDFFKHASLSEGLISFGAVDDVANSYKPYDLIDNSIIWSFPITIISYSDPALGDKLMRSITPNLYYLLDIHRTIDNYQNFSIDQLSDVSPAQFKNKIVLFGYLGPHNEDKIKTDVGDMYATVILANSIGNLLDGIITKDDLQDRKTTAPRLSLIY